VSIFDNTRQTFNIYTSDALDSDNVNAQSPVITFTGLMSADIKRQYKIPTVALENGSFANDSLQELPFTLTINAIHSPFVTGFGYTKDDKMQDIALVVAALKEYAANDKFLTILTSSLFEVYENMKIIDSGYRRDSYTTYLNAYITFQEVNLTEAEYDETKYRDKTQGDIQDRGEIAPQEVSDSQAKFYKVK